MKINYQNLIIGGMAIIIVMLFWRINTINTNFKVFKESQELQNKETLLTIKKNQLQSELNDLSNRSKKSVNDAEKIIIELKNTNNEKPKIKTESQKVMLEFISTYKPE